MDNDSAEVTSSGRSFHVRGPTTGKARLATVVNLTGKWHQPDAPPSTTEDRLTFPAAAARAWNSLPPATRAGNSLLQCRRQTQAHFFRQSFLDCPGSYCRYSQTAACWQSGVTAPTCCSVICVKCSCSVNGMTVLCNNNKNNFSYRLQNRAPALCFRLINMLLSEICFFLVLRVGFLANLHGNGRTRVYKNSIHRQLTLPRANTQHISE